MSQPDPHDGLSEMLRLTRERELDCEAFLKRLAAYVDQQTDGELLALMGHHKEICAECAEAVAILERALGID